MTKIIKTTSNVNLNWILLKFEMTDRKNFHQEFQILVRKKKISFKNSFSNMLRILFFVTICGLNYLIKIFRAIVKIFREFLILLRNKMISFKSYASDKLRILFFTTICCLNNLIKIFRGIVKIFRAIVKSLAQNLL